MLLLFFLLLTCCCVTQTGAQQSVNPCTLIYCSTQVPSLSALIATSYQPPYNASLVYVSTYSVIGTHTHTNDTLILTSNDGITSGNAVWFKQPIRFTDYFHITFSFELLNFHNTSVNQQSEGFAFVLLDPTASLEYAQGTGSLNIGYNIAQYYSLAVEFDTHYDGNVYDPMPPNSQAVPTNYRDYACNHVEVHGSFTDKINGPSQALKLFPSSTIQPTWLQNNALTQGAHLVDIQYQSGYFSYGNGLLSVNIDSTTILEYPINDAQVSTIFANNTAFIGFTASTGTEASTSAAISCDTLIYNISVYTNLAAPQYTRVHPNNGSSAISTASTVISPIATIQAYDYCNKSFSISAGEISAYITSPTKAQGIVSMEDLDDGIYVLSASSTTAVSFAISCINNAQSILISSLALNVLPATVSAANSVVSVSPAGTSLSSLTVGQALIVQVTLRDIFNNFNTTSNASPSDIQIVLNNPGTQTNDVFLAYTRQGALFYFNVTTKYASRLSSQGVLVAGAMYITAFGSNVASSPITPVFVSSASVWPASCVFSGNDFVTLTSGTNATFNLNPFDAYGNPILESLIGSFALVGMTTSLIWNASFAWMSSVLPPIAQFVVSPTVVDTYAIQASIGYTKQSLQPVYDDRKPVVLPSTVPNANNSYVFGSTSDLIAGNLTNNAGVVLYVVISDLYGNQLTQPLENSYLLTIMIQADYFDAPSLRVDCSSMYLSPSTLLDSVMLNNRLLYNSLTCSYSQASSSYNINLFVYQTEIFYRIFVSLNGTAIHSRQGQNLSFQVYPAAADAFESFYQLLNTSLIAGQIGYISITIFDSFGNLRTETDDSALIWSTPITLTSPYGHVTLSSADLVPVGNATYIQSFVAQVATKYVCTVSLAGSLVSVKGTNSITILPGIFNASTIQVQSTGWQGGVAGSVQTFDLLPADTFGNLLLTSYSHLNFGVNASTSIAWNLANVTLFSNSSLDTQMYQVQYIVPVSDASNSTLVLSIYTFANSLPSLCLVLFGTVLQQSTDNSLTVFPSQTLVAGVPSIVSVIPRNVNLQSICTTDRFSLTLLPLDTNYPSVLSQSFICVDVDNDMSSCCKYNYTLTPLVATSYKLKVLVISDTGVAETSQSASGVFIFVNPGAVDAHKSQLQALSNDVLVAGQLFHFQILFMDAYGNAWKTSPNASVYLTSTMPEQPLFPFTYIDQLDGTYLASVGYSTASYQVLNVILTSVSQSIGNGMGLLYTSTFLSPAFSSINSVTATSGAISLVAGDSTVISINAFDMYGNAILSGLACNASFQRAFDQAQQSFTTQGANRLSMQQPTAENGAWLLTTSPLTLANPNQPLTVVIFCGIENQPWVSLPAGIVSVSPNSISDLLSSIAFWPYQAVEAGTNIELVANLVDQFGNPWASTLSGGQVRALFSAVNSKYTVVVNQEFASSVTTTFDQPGRYNISYTPTLAASAYSLVLVDDAGNSHSFNVPPFAVVSQQSPAADRTVMSPSLPSNLTAGANVTLQVTFFDVYGNIISNKHNESSYLSLNWKVSFYIFYPASYCASGEIVTGEDVSALFYITSLTPTLNNSSWYFSFTVIVVGQYFLMPFLDGSPILTDCAILPSSLVIEVVQSSPSPYMSLISQLTPGSVTKAGEILDFHILIRDAYKNTITQLLSSVVVSVATTSATCNSTLPLYTLARNDSISSFSQGMFFLSIDPFIAGKYLLPVMLNNQLIGGPAGCITVDVEANDLASFSKTQEGVVVTGELVSFQLQGQDMYHNFLSPSQLMAIPFDAEFTYLDSPGPTNTVFNFTSQQTPSDETDIIYYIDQAGLYNVSVYAVDSLPVNPAPIFYQLMVQAADCVVSSNGSTTFRCPGGGQCTSSYENCEGYRPCRLGEIPLGNFGTQCLQNYLQLSTLDCPANLSLCVQPNTSALIGQEGMNFFCAVTCPQASTITAGQVDCGSGVFRNSQDDCPSTHVCPYGYFACFDGSCALNTSTSPTCGDPISWSEAGDQCKQTKGYQCRTGTCAARAENCPTDVTCPNNEVVCSDGSCQPSADDCLSPSVCSLPFASYRCSRGQCRNSSLDCPTYRTCPQTWVMCENGQCAISLDSCIPPNGTDCTTVGLMTCPDGTCRGSLIQCPSQITCPSQRSVRCGNDLCVADILLCPTPPVCVPPNSFVCPDATCASNATFCSTSITCPLSVPVLCEDSTCRASINDCEIGIVQACSSDRPVRCVDGSCSGAYSECPSLTTCPSNLPVKCPDGRCTDSLLACPSPPWICPESQVSCPFGGCASSFQTCPTSVTCSQGLQRCSDGSCRNACSLSLALAIYSQCANQQSFCPETATGRTCASNLLSCPTSLSCPQNAPVRCADRSCALSPLDCPQVSALLSTQFLGYACEDGGWQDSLASCGTSVTCPAFAPVKCWDESCRIHSQDCPPKQACSLSSVPGTASFLCSDGSCQPTLSACSSLLQCPPGQIKCPSDVSNGDGVFCVSNSTLCVNLFVDSNAISTCPNSYARCRAGNCVPSLSSCASMSCPDSLPFMCLSGVCATSNSSCPLANGCPFNQPQKCWDGSCASSNITCSTPQPCPNTAAKRCLDGSCTLTECDSPNDTGCAAGLVRCADKQCAPSWDSCSDTSDLYNACPASRPFRCQDGYCSVTASACPTFPNISNTPCTNNESVLCADGSCVQSSLQCPFVQPCSTDMSRCGDGSCRYASDCPTVNTCPSDRPLRCQSGLCVAATVIPYTTFLESASSPDQNCIDEIERDGLNGSEPDSRGCPRGLTKCLNGLCQSVCSVSASSQTSIGSLAAFRWPFTSANGCFDSKLPIKCSDGTCASSNSLCASASGCPTSSPTLCPDGSCSASALNCSLLNLECPLNQVRCPNQQCSFNLSSCKAVNGCPLLFPVRCASGQCAQFPASSSFSIFTNISATYTDTVFMCPPVVMCDIVRPYLCADMSCVSSFQECTSVQPCSDGNYCPYSNVCVDADQECPQHSCPFRSPVLCPDGTCTSSPSLCPSSPFLRVAGSFQSPCSSSQFLCFDGTCASSALQCISSSFSLRYPSAIFNPSVDPTNATCNITATPDAWICSNGLCLPGSDLITRSLCPIIPGCPVDKPLRCPDGSCILSNDTSACSFVSNCAPGLARCSDGTCRSSISMCPAANGCPPDNGFFCPGQSQICVANASMCSTILYQPSSNNSISQIVTSTVQVSSDSNGQYCETDCKRDVSASPFSVTVQPASSVAISISFDDSHVLTTQLFIPSGALGSSIAILTILPIAESQVQSSVTPFAQTVLSTPFGLLVNGSPAEFFLNTTVFSAVDMQSSSSSISSVTSAATIQAPCAILVTASAPYDIQPYLPNEENSTCQGTLILAATTMQLEWVTGCSAGDSGASIEGTLQSIPVTPYADGFINSFGAACLCYNITSSFAGLYITGSSFCMLISHATATSPFIAAFSRDLDQVQVRCPGVSESSSNNNFLQLTLPSSVLSAASGCSSSQSITTLNAVDICLGQYTSTTRSWSCVYSDYNYRQSSPPWTSESGRAPDRMQSLLPSCQADAYAFMYSPAVMPSPIPPPSCDLWCQYEAVILGVTIGCLVFLLISGYVIWRLSRYRQKYLANKKEHQGLKDRATHLEEYAGGLGFADDDLRMIANPMVLEMNVIDDKISRMADNSNSNLCTDSEQYLQIIKDLEARKAALYQRVMALRTQVDETNAKKQPARASAFVPSSQISPFAPLRSSISTSLNTSSMLELKQSADIKQVDLQPAVTQLIPSVRRMTPPPVPDIAHRPSQVQSGSSLPTDPKLLDSVNTTSSIVIAGDESVQRTRRKNSI